MKIKEFVKLLETHDMDKEMLDDNGIEVDNSNKVLAKKEDKNLYLVSNY